MQRKVLTALQNLFENNPVLLSGIVELDEIFHGHIAEDTLVLTDRLRSYNILKTLASCMVVDVKREKSRGIFNPNTVDSLHSFIKEIYSHYRGVDTKYVNRYNVLFSITFQ